MSITFLIATLTTAAMAFVISARRSPEPTVALSMLRRKAAGDKHR